MATVSAYDPRRRRMLRLAVGAGLLLAWILLQVDDWGRDLTGYRAQTSPTASDPLLRTLQRPEPARELVQAIKWAAFRMRNVQYIGETSDKNTTLVLFVRTHRLLRIKDDIVMRVEDQGSRRLVGGAAESRLHVGDLGRNPRSLRRLRAELLAVLGNY